MAVKTVTNANLAEYVAERQAKGSQVATGETVVTVDAKVSTEGKPVVGVVGSGAETLDTGSPPPPDAKPTAQVKAEKEKSDKADDKENPFKDRIKELTDRNKELDEFAQGEYEGRIALQKQISQLEAEVKRLKPPEPKVEEVKPPDPKSFTNQAEYDAAVEKYQNAIIDRRVEAKLAAAQERAHQERIAQLLEERAQLAGKEIQDYWEVMRTRGPATPEAPGHIKAAIFEWETGAKLAYHFAKYPAEVKRIYAMTPIKAMEALAALDRQYAKSTAEPVVESAPAPAAVPVTTRAPAPVTPIKPSGEMVPQDMSSPMAFTDYRARRLADIRAKRQAGRK